MTLHSFGHPKRKRVTIDCSHPELTDQSSKKMCDINNIMAQYQKTGLLPNIRKDMGRFVDNTLAIPLEEAYGRLNEAKELFYKLPAQLRKQMDNDPTKLEAFILNPENKDQLIKYKLVNPKEEKKEFKKVEVIPKEEKPVENKV